MVRLRRAAPLLLLAALRVDHAPPAATLAPPGSTPTRSVRGVVERGLLAEAPPPCSVRVRVLEDGQPMVGVRVELGWDVHTTDADGRTVEFERPCGPDEVFVRRDDALYGPVAVRFEAGREATVRFGDGSTGELVVVDDGVPIDVELDTDIRACTVERLGTGWYRLSAPGILLDATLRAPGYLDAPISVALTDEQSRVNLVAGRQVEVDATCDPEGCPELWCDEQPCEAEGEVFSCTCPAADATLHARPVAAEPTDVPAGVAVVSVDLRGSGTTVTGTWGGLPPCLVVLREAPRERTIRCSSDTFSVDNAGPGRVQVCGADGACAHRSVGAESGIVDLGWLLPDAGRVEGTIHAWFPLDAVRLTSSPRGRGRVEADGRFVVEDLPAEGPVTLSLSTGERGRFTLETEVGASPRWELPAFAERGISAREERVMVRDAEGQLTAPAGDSASPSAAAESPDRATSDSAGKDTARGDSAADSAPQEPADARRECWG